MESVLESQVTRARVRWNSLKFESGAGNVPYLPSQKRNANQDILWFQVGVDPADRAAAAAAAAEVTGLLRRRSALDAKIQELSRRVGEFLRRISHPLEIV